MTTQLSDAVRSEQVGNKIVPVLTFPSGTWIHLMPHKIDGGQDPADVLKRWLCGWVEFERVRLGAIAANHDELHELLDSVQVDGSCDLSDSPTPQGTLGTTLRGVLERSEHLTENYRHYHKGPARECAICGLDMTDAIHRRTK